MLQGRPFMLAAGSCWAVACASTPATRAEVGAQPASRPSAVTNADHARCELEERADRDIVETRAIASRQASIRRVYRISEKYGQRQRTLACREMDTNLDGLKDVVRYYDDRGQPIEERADANYDGVIDTWVKYFRGRVVKVEIDEAWDGQPDEIRYYSGGKLIRIERDSNQDGKTDIWEVYLDGHLDRIGLDLNYDGRVDRWNRDLLARRLHREAINQSETSSSGEHATADE
jgi:hypothetical protein